MADAPDLDIETLRLVVAVDDTGSLSAAARERGLSQPSASARVRAFEARWQLTLLERTPRGSTITTDGRAVIARARQVLREADTMRAGLASLTGSRRGEVRIAASLTIAEHILPRWLGALRDQMEVHPQLHVVNSDRVADMVRSQLADVGFIETAARAPGLDHRVVGTDRLVVVVHPDHEWARRRTPFVLRCWRGRSGCCARRGAAPAAPSSGRSVRCRRSPCRPARQRRSWERCARHSARPSSRSGPSQPRWRPGTRSSPRRPSTSTGR
uniref:LysR family transcriptional regulator n=1 Tax=Janibacter limosus TaxID=53458 RepID=A0AC61U7K4_9MICO|nr:LysR family transcriptional regulator [Janibacter limosus]